MQINTIFINKIQVKEIEDCITLNTPYETCGILTGIKNKENLFIKEIFFMENMEKSSIKFRMDEDRLLEIYSTAESKNQSVIGILHSHPSEALPSKTDLKYMEINPIPWIIKSTTTNELRCFIYNDTQKYKEINIKIMG